jgi:hypothetical protein
MQAIGVHACMHERAELVGLAAPFCKRKHLGNDHDLAAVLGLN